MLFSIKVWFSNRRAKYRREDKVKGRRQNQQQQQQLINDMGENMRPSGTTPPPPSSLYPQVFPSTHNSIPNDPHHSHHYGAFSSGFTAIACSSSGYPTFFPSMFL